MWVVVGLGNPGKRYAATRHNLGFRVVDKIAGTFKKSWSEEQRDGYSIAMGDDPAIVLVKPTTYMNASGFSVRKSIARFGSSPGDLLVVLDDVNLPLGSVRIRRKGSDGGHRGLLSVVQDLGTIEFSRLRMGVGPPSDDVGMADFVLGDFSPKENAIAEEMVHRAAHAVHVVLTQGIDTAMNQFNSG